MCRQITLHTIIKSSNLLTFEGVFLTLNMLTFSQFFYELCVAFENMRYKSILKILQLCNIYICTHNVINPNALKWKCQTARNLKYICFRSFQYSKLHFSVIKLINWFLVSFYRLK